MQRPPNRQAFRKAKSQGQRWALLRCVWVFLTPSATYDTKDVYSCKSRVAGVGDGFFLYMIRV
jgi:hypothetical protein